MVCCKLVGLKVCPRWICISYKGVETCNRQNYPSKAQMGRRMSFSVDRSMAWGHPLACSKRAKEEEIGKTIPIICARGRCDERTLAGLRWSSL